MNVLWVGIGGAAGVCLRALVDTVIQSSFPFSTLFVNFLGSFLLGLLSTAPVRISKAVRLALTTGLIGSFTTLSAVSAELFGFLQQAQYGFAILYFAGSLAGGFVLAYCGIRTGERI